MSIEPAGLIDRFVAEEGSDLYLSVGAPARIRVGGRLKELTEGILSREDVEAVAALLIPAEGLAAFAEKWEMNAASDWRGEARLRINLFKQRHLPGVVVRRVAANIPLLDELGVPEAYGRLAMERRGLVIVAGPTGSGKSTSLAAMIGHRNAREAGHIITIEDPVEYIHPHGRGIVTQRDVGIDTHSFAEALKNALRQSPDVIMIGEVRDRDVMEQALTYAEAGHLVLATLHAGNAQQCIERILHFFPEEKQRQVQLYLSLNLRGILSQRLVHGVKQPRVLATQVLLNQGAVREMIREGKMTELNDLIERGADQGMQSFEQALLKLWKAGEITPECALAEADTPANLNVLMRQEGYQKS